MNNQVRIFYDDDAKQYDSRWVTTGGSITAGIQRQIVSELTFKWTEYGILEVGTGTGRFSGDLVEHASRYFAVDLSRNMLRSTVERVSHHSTSKVIPSQGSIYSLPFPNSTFDALFSVNVLNHVEDIEKALIEIFRVLKAGGEFLISFTNLSSYYLPFAVIVNRRGRAIGKNVYSRWRSYNAFKESLMDVGFEIDEIRGNVHVPKWLDLPVARTILSQLDKYSRDGLMSKFAPTIFILGHKKL